jgi:C-22 sterol desaturase
MSSSITFGFQYMADRPDVMAKIREEQELVRGGNYEADVTPEQLDRMTYTRAMVKETLRIKPPVIMVPYMTTKRMPITEDYSVPKGSILIPSFYNSLHDPAVYPDPEAFNPDRFMPGGNSEKSDPKHFLVFGSGPHKCIGYEYVYMHMASVLGAAAATMDIEHARTPDSDELKCVPCFCGGRILTLPAGSSAPSSRRTTAT